MSTLPQDLELLRKLNEYRWRAKELREQALPGLKQIECKEIRPPRDARESPFTDKDKEVERGGIDFERWVAGNDDVEIALLVKVQNHRDISVNENENNMPRNASHHLKKALIDLDLKQLLKQSGEAGNRSEFPVLLAARTMQALVTRAETVFNPATMYCYYRIIRELYGVAHPNWTVGAARAGVGGTTSAFVTNECIRAIFAFERALERTHKFFEQTCIFCRYYLSVKSILRDWKIAPESPLNYWANKSIEAMWLDCQIATNPRNREMALFHAGGTDGRNALLLPDENKPVDLKSATSYFDSLPMHLKGAVDDLFQAVAGVYDKIKKNRRKETPKTKSPIRPIRGSNPQTYEYIRPAKGITEPERKKERGKEEETTKFIRTETAHAFALKVIENAVDNAHTLQMIVQKWTSGTPDENKHATILDEMAKEFYTITRRVRHVLDPSKQYLKWVLGRELAALPATFDAGELVFAATSYGAINNWRLDDRLNRACERLVTSLPDNGRLPTKRPFHADRRGYRTIPIGCEMTRALATLLQKTGYDFDANFVGKMLGVFEEQLIELHESAGDDKKLIGWNFEGAPSPEKPAIWVTAVSILALDRVVRMLNTRINEVVLAHFDVTQPKRPHTELTLQHLIYSDYALVGYGPPKKADERLHQQQFDHQTERTDPSQHEERLTAINLQKTRAHVMRTTLPERYRQDNKHFSTIYYGPPGTGKTTLAESLALSAGVPLLRLSPGDLILQGQELIEGRAHDVFEALSMLTQCVIIFDEFEPVLKSRGDETKSTSKDRGELQLPHDGLGEPPASRESRHGPLREALTRIADILQDISEKDDLKEIGGALQSISEKDDPKFRFVLGGMLPKLIKLHDSAQKQSFVYCLATNRLKEIDVAAKRNGRFDKKTPVYKPDALSRAGTLLHCLSQAKKVNLTGKKTERSGELQRFMRILCKTIGEPADRINKFFKIEKNEEELIGVLGYILNDTELPKELEESRKRLEKLELELLTDETLDEEEGEKAQRIWICGYEKQFADKEDSIDQSGDEIIKLLNRSLAGESMQEQTASKRT